MKDWQYEPAPDLEKPLGERLRTFPRQPDMSIYTLRTMSAVLLRLVLRLVFRLRIHGRENLPEEGSFVMVANHSSHLDAPCLLSALPLERLHRAFPAAAADYFFSSVPRSFLAAVAVNALPFDRRGGGERSLELCRRMLEAPGHVLVLFPEGTRTQDGSLGRFRSGIGRLVAGLDVPVVPCHLEGAYDAWPKGRLVPRPRRLTLRIGEPRGFAHRSDERASVRAIGSELREAVRELGPQE